jgi:hypothetical protein
MGLRYQYSPKNKVPGCSGTHFQSERNGIKHANHNRGQFLLLFQAEILKIKQVLSDFHAT